MKTKKIRPYRFTVALFLALVLTLGFAVNTTKVFAIPDVQYYGGNDILFFDPDAVECAADGGGSLRGNSVTEKIWSYLVDKGLSPEQAAGVMGNLDAESGYVVTSRQGSGDLLNSNFTENAWGLAQWDGGRRFTSPDGGIIGKLRSKHPELMKYTTTEYGGSDGNKKVPAADLDTLLLFELDYLYQESTNRRVSATGFGKADNEWATLKLQKTVEDATVFWHNNFEVSDDSAAQVLSNRGGKAQKAFDSFSTNTGKTGSSSTGSTEGCDDASTATATGDLSKLTLAYAWPDYRGSGYMTRKPEYITAVKTASDAGKYTGACNGVDCGGFVTLLVNNSGLDPAYNSHGKGGNTTAQYDWAKKNWTTIGNGGSVKVGGSETDSKVLRAGDVAIKHGHTFIYVGKIPGFGSKIASASECDRAPMAGKESATDNDFTWFRKK